jgi:Acetyltransferases, including N-acetylases of ribosomal proteins
MKTELVTQRLRIIPLNLKQLKLMLTDFSKLENEMHWNPSNVKLDEHLVEVMRLAFDLASAHSAQLLWLTNWQIVENKENRSIGSLCFHSLPNDDGLVEIGYGINETYRGHGYATEAVGALCKWALQQREVKAIVAETEKNNYASCKVLVNNGFHLVGEIGELHQWKLNSKF